LCILREEPWKVGLIRLTGTLFVCATPIGNLKDITLRALEVLRAVPLIAAEDTRHTLKLLNHFEIKTSLTSYHQHNEQGKSSELLVHLKEGKDLALVSDAGLPGISDPGEILVRKAIAAGIPVEVIPGPSAFTTGLVISGLPTNPLYFAGFLPSSGKARRDSLRRIKGIEATHAFYEAPHRLEKFLADVAEVYGEVEVVVARELTKLHQELIRGKVTEVLAQLAKIPARGEIVVYVMPPKQETPPVPTDWTAEVAKLVGDGLTKKEAIKALAEKYKVPKREVYNYVEQSSLE